MGDPRSTWLRGLGLATLGALLYAWAAIPSLGGAAVAWVALVPLLGAIQGTATNTAFGIGAVSIACFPPFNGFAGEFVLALSLLDGSSLPGVEQQLGLLMALVVLGLVSGLAAATTFYCLSRFAHHI